MKSLLRITIAVILGLILLVFIWARLPKSAQDAVSRVKPPLPVSVTFRKALLGAGDVARISNESGRELPLVVIFTSATFKESKTFKLVVDAGSFQEVGHKEGWTVAQGDVMQLSSDGYQSQKIRLSQ